MNVRRTAVFILMLPALIAGWPLRTAAQALLPATERAAALMQHDMEQRAGRLFESGDYADAEERYGELAVRFGDPDGRYAFGMARCRLRAADRRSGYGILDSLRRAWPAAAWRPQLEIETGHARFRAANYPAALHSYLKADSLVPGLPLESPDSRIRFGTALMWNDSLARAVRVLSPLDADSVLGDYVHYWLAECYGRMDSSERRMIELHRLVTRFPASIHTPGARMEMAGFYYDAGFTNEALALYRDGDAFASGSEERALVRYRSGMLLAATGAYGRADSAWLDAMRQFPAAKWAWEARIALINSRTDRGMTLQGRERYDNAAVMAAHAQNGAAVKEALRFIEQNPGHRLHADALFLAGLCRYRQRKYRQAAINFTRLRTRFPEHDLAGDALLYLARCDRKRHRTRQAEEEYRAFAAAYPGHGMADDALWSIAWDRESSGKLASAAAAYDELARKMPHTRYGGEAAWRAGFCRYKNGQVARAADAFARIDTSYEHYLQDQAGYWYARCLERLGNRPAADSLVAAVAGRYPRTYYSVRAHERLHGAPVRIPDSLFVDTPDEDAVTNDVYGAYWLQFGDSLGGGGGAGLPLGAVVRLVQLYLFDEARDELVRLEERAGTNRAALAELARVYYENGYTYRAYRTFRTLLGLTFGSDTDAFPLSAFQFLYPIRYLGPVLRYARAHGTVDPFLTLALMHQESRFNHLACSRADARGLMQIMPATGREIAQRLRVRPYHTDSLYVPEVNIRFGTAYLAWQLERFGNDVLHTLASYNGGMGNVRRWLKQYHGTDADVFIENIPFRETRKYVKIVYRNYHLYRFLWGPHLLRQPALKE